MRPENHQDRMRYGFWVTFGIFLAGFLLQLVTAPSPGIVGFELAFTEKQAGSFLGDWEEDGILEAQTNLRFDYLFIFGYVVFIGSVLRWTLQDEKGKNWLWPRGRSLLGLTAFAGLFDVVENLFLQHVLRNPRSFGGVSVAVAGTAAALKFLLLAIVIFSWGAWIVRKRPELLARTKEWLEDLWSIFKICRASVIVLIAGVAFLVFVPQGRDIVISLAEPPLRARLLFLIWFLAAVTFWAFNIWYWARVMLRFDFGQSSAGEGRSGRAGHIREHFPRLLGMLAFLAVTGGFVRAALDTTGKTALGHWILAVWTVAMALMFYGATMLRRSLTEGLQKHAQQVDFLQKGLAGKMVDGIGVESRRDAYATDLRVAEDLRAVARFVIGLLFVMTAAMFLMFSIDPAKGACFRSGPILLLAGAAWVPVGSLLVFLSYKLRFPLMTTLIVGLVVFSYWNDNHAVRTLPTQRAVIAPSVGAHFPKWLEARGIEGPRRRFSGDRYPVVVVAAEGGGIRAAYWTATVLAALEDAYSGPRGERFSDHVYAISGVSGGSLGAAVFDALVKERLVGSSVDCSPSPAGASKAGSPGGERRKGPFELCADRMLQRDFLAPTLAAMLYPDLVQRFLPFPVPRFDRGRALEQSWEHAWSALGFDRHHFGKRRQGPGFHDLWKNGSADDSHYYRLPLLFLNTTSVETGRRVLISPIQIGPEFADAHDYFDANNGRDIRLSSAVHNSARFTFVSPAGTVKKKDGSVWGHVVDGGYFENSGATTALEILQAMEESVSHDRKTGVRHSLWGARVQPIVLMITNDPALGSEPEPRRFLNEALSPVVALLKTRGARGSYSRDALSDTVSEDCAQCFVEIHLRGIEGVPLGWVLSEGARDQMNREIDAQLEPVLELLEAAARRGQGRRE